MNNPPQQPPPARQSENDVKCSGGWWPFAAVSIGSFLGPLAGSIVIVALPSMARDFDVDMQSIKWIVLIYLMVGTILLPPFGVLGQRLGASRLFILGFMLFALGALLSALTPLPVGLYWVLGARLIQSIGAACLFGVNLALVTRVVPVNRRGLAFGIIGSIVSIALIVGQPLGAIICDALGWRWVFWIQVPVALTGMVMAYRMLPPDIVDRRIRVAVWNFLTWLCLIVSLAVLAEAFAKGLWVKYLPLNISIAVGAALLFGWLEKRGPRLFDYSLFRHGAYWRGTIGAFFVYLTMFSLMLFLPFYLEDYLMLTTSQRTLFYALGPLVTVFSGPLAGWIADKSGYRIPVITGLVILTTSYLLAAAAVAGEQLVMLGFALALLGAGNGLFGSINYSAMMSCASDMQRSHAASFCSLTRNFGFMVGTSLGSVLFGLFLFKLGGHELMIAARTQQLVQAVSPAQFVYAWKGVLLVSSMLIFISLLFSLRYPNRPDVTSR